ncbi:MAG: M23 family metallopeptidase [Saprospiraceae bacterium]|nr:M23 family metallopeptidase [Saprospiraceae bacterium]
MVSRGTIISHLLVLFLGSGLTQSLTAHAQAPSEARMFNVPVRHPIKLSGTFGELRDHHFHYGIDIKSSTGDIGDPVYAIASGFISRIRVHAGGYGNALFVEHGDGLTSLYAHLDSFTPEVADLVQKDQDDREVFEVDIIIPGQQFPVASGALVGTMGNTGHSHGPHLHFEVRQTSTGTPINPLRLNFPITDKTGPRILGIYLYYLDKEKYSYAKKMIHPPERPDTIEVDATSLGFGIESLDLHNGGLNMNGIYAISLQVDDTLFYSARLDSLPSDDLDSYLAHIDHATWIETGTLVQRCYRLPGNRMTIYQLKDDGIISLPRKKVRKVVFSVSDYHGNIRNCIFFVKQQREVTEPEYALYQHKIRWSDPYKIEGPGYLIELPAESLYEDLSCSHQIIEDTFQHYLSPIHYLHNPTVPLRKQISIAIRPDRNTPYHSKSVIIDCTGSGKATICGGIWDDGYLTAETASLGRFAVALDTTPPTLELLKRSQSNNILTHIFQVTDNYRYRVGLQGVRYRAEIDGEWVMTTFDTKSNRAECRVDLTSLSKGSHNLEFLVTDYVGNRTNYDLTFFTK